MIFGVLPAALGIGPGAETRAPMAVATAPGMFSSMLLTLLVVPVFYLLFDDAAEWVKRGFKRVFGSKRSARSTPTERGSRPKEKCTMRRFIHHSELARDSRFVRQDNALATVLAPMPDDVDTVVASSSSSTR